EAADQPAALADCAHYDTRPVLPPQHAPHVADGVDQAERDRLLAGPDVALEQLLLRRLQADAATCAHEILEAVVNVDLDRVEPGDVLRRLGTERIEQTLAAADRMHAPLDP